MSAATKQLRISHVEFATEILRDLPYLMHEYKDGLYVRDLKDYYGESSNRIRHALSVLINQGIVELRQAPDKTYYIVLKGQEPPQLVELTEMQRRIARFVMSTCKKSNTTKLQTDYSQLSRVLKISPVGLRSTMVRMHTLGYLLLSEPSQIGFPCTMILTIGPKLQKAFEDYHLDT